MYLKYIRYRGSSCTSSKFGICLFIIANPHLVRSQRLSSLTVYNVCNKDKKFTLFTLKKIKNSNELCVLISLIEVNHEFDHLKLKYKLSLVYRCLQM